MWAGAKIVPVADGASLEWSQHPVLHFSQNVDVLALKPSTSVVGDDGSVPAYSMYSRGNGQIDFWLRFTPGVTYTITSGPAIAHVTSPKVVVVPTPSRVVDRTVEPYRIGALEHPFSFSLAGTSGAQQIKLLGDARVGYARIDYCGSQLYGNNKVAQTPNPIVANFATEDAILNELHAAGVTEMPILDQYCAPRFWTNDGGGSAIYIDPNNFFRFATDVATHLKQFPWVTRIEIFNEPNLHGWWSYPIASSPYNDRSGKAAAVYMKGAYAAIKAANPNLTVVGPALADGGWHTDSRGFLATMYANGCKTGVCWDALSVHNYRWADPTGNYGSNENRFDVYKDLQAIAVKNGDPIPHVMLTEWGYSTVNAPEGFDPQVQARYLALGLNRALADPTVDGVTYVNVYNAASDFWGHTALTNADFTLKPAYFTLKDFTGAL